MMKEMLFVGRFLLSGYSYNKKEVIEEVKVKI